MTIAELKALGIINENEQIVVFSGDVSNPHRLYEGRLCNIPAELDDKKVWEISAMGERRRERYNLNKYGWLEIWLEEEDED